ncbi:MAG TPA: POTRA domain-containing protein [Terriglobales bacterium]|nr:POTRA domain-containing protein [Terriglobales bacterium]
MLSINGRAANSTGKVQRPRGSSWARWSCVVTLLATLATGQNKSAQQTPQTAPQVKEILPSYEGQRVVAVEIAGKPGLNENELQPFLLQKEGESFAQAKVDQSMDALKRSGKVKDVELEIRPQADGVRVMFVLQPAIYFGMFTFPGAQRFAYSRLLQVADYPPRGAYSPIDVTNTRNSLLHFFQQSGFFQAEVHSELKNDDVHKVVNVEFHVTLKRHAKFGKVVFEGAPPALEPKLQGDIKSLRARLRGLAIRRGKNYSLRTVQKATQYLESKLIDRDYLGSRVELAGAEYDPSSNLADVHFKVTPGQIAHVRIEGAHLWGRTRKKLLPLYEQAGLDPEILQEGRQNLVSYFQSKGYFEVKVDTRTQAAQGGENIVYLINKGPRHSVAKVAIVGNHTLPDADLRGHIKVQKKGIISFFSHGKFSNQLVKQSTDNLEKVYEAEGFSSVKVTPEITKTGENIVATFHVDEGPRDIVESLQLNGNDTVPKEKLAPQGLKVVEGQPYSTKKVDEDRNQIIAQYLRMGYLNANLRATAHKVANNPPRLTVTYMISEGPRVMIDSVATLGARSTRQSLIDSTVRLKPEVPLREDELFGAESRLYNLEIFDWAEIDPRRQITTQNQEDVLVKVHESKENEIRYGFGFEVINRGGSIPGGTVAVPGLPPVGLPNAFQTSEKTFWGPRGTFQYKRKNVRGLGESMTIALLGARLIQRVGFSYADPYFLGKNWSSNFSLTGERNSENPIYTSRYEDVGYQVLRSLNAAGTKTLSLRYGFRHTILGNLLIPDLVPESDRNLHLSAPAASYSYDTRDNPLDAKKGMYQTADFDINLKPLGSSVNFARLRFQYARYKEIGAGIIWANSARVGLAQPFAGSHVPVSELFYTGGGSTLRGFPLNGAGPQHSVPACGNPADPSTCVQITVPEGGRELLILNSELRIPVPIKKGLGLATFYDGGNVFPSIGFRDFSSYTNTVGIGLRYNTPVGPVRIDLGHNLNAPPGIKSTQFFITLGQAF